jgi:hypothetical protein
MNGFEAISYQLGRPIIWRREVVIMNGAAVVLIVGAILVVAIVALLITIIAAIHADERRRSLTSPPSTRAEALARRIIGVHSDYHNTVGVTRVGIWRCH